MQHNIDCSPGCGVGGVVLQHKIQVHRPPERVLVECGVRYCPGDTKFRGAHTDDAGAVYHGGNKASRDEAGGPSSRGS